MLFSPLLESLVNDRGEWIATVPDDWMQGRSVFGGLQAALAVRAMRSLVPAEIPLRVLQTTFVAPVPAGPVRLRAHVLRTGKNAVHVEARIVDGDQSSCVAVGVFGRGRASRVRVTARAPEPSGPGAARVRSGEGRSIVAFAQHFTMRWLEGGVPFSGSTLPRAVIEVGMRDTAPAAGEAHVVAIADSIPPVALSLLDAPAFGSSLTWTLELLAHDAGRWALDGWILHAELTAGHDGYTSQSVLVCAPDGTPVALSRQSMVVFG